MAGLLSRLCRKNLDENQKKNEKDAKTVIFASQN
jgi:hypothetical protein